MPIKTVFNILYLASAQINMLLMSKDNVAIEFIAIIRHTSQLLTLSDFIASRP